MTSATGAMNFLVFTLSCFLGPVCGFARHRLRVAELLTLQKFHRAHVIRGGVIALSLIQTAFLRETAAATRPAPLAVQARAS